MWGPNSVPIDNMDDREGSTDWRLEAYRTIFRDLTDHNQALEDNELNRDMDHALDLVAQTLRVINVPR